MFDKVCRRKKIKNKIYQINLTDSNLTVQLKYSSFNR